jgi:hypothetical protein
MHASLPATPASYGQPAIRRSRAVTFAATPPTTFTAQAVTVEPRCSWSPARGLHSPSPPRTHTSAIHSPIRSHRLPGWLEHGCDLALQMISWFSMRIMTIFPAASTNAPCEAHARTDNHTFSRLPPTRNITTSSAGAHTRCPHANRMSLTRAKEPRGSSVMVGMWR